MTVQLKAKGQCDFCPNECNADMVGARVYPCKDFALPGTGNFSRGAWGACPDCAALIDARKWDAQVERMVEQYTKTLGVLAAGTRYQMRMRDAFEEQIKLFRFHRIV
jgi:hypothetical protein